MFEVNLHVGNKQDLILIYLMETFYYCFYKIIDPKILNRQIISVSQKIRILFYDIVEK